MYCFRGALRGVMAAALCAAASASFSQPNSFIRMTQQDTSEAQVYLPPIYDGTDGHFFKGASLQHSQSLNMVDERGYLLHLNDYGDAQANFGDLHSYAYSFNELRGFNKLETYTDIRALVTDTLTIDSAGLTGTRATLHAQFEITGNGDVMTFGADGNKCTATAQAGWESHLNMHSGSGDLFTWKDTGGTTDSSGLGVHDVTLEFTLGNSTSIEMFTDNAAFEASYQFPAAPNPTGGRGVFDLDLRWLGISSVTDTNGNSLNFTISSESGFNYRDAYTPAVPEPASMCILATGALALLRRRRRS